MKKDAINETKSVCWIWWPFIAVWRLLTWILKLTGRLVAAVIGLALAIVGLVLIVLVITLPVGIPLLILGILLMLRAIF